MATTPFGDISNHYKDEDWGLFNIEERPFAKVWDGHNSADVLYRLEQTIKNENGMDSYVLRQYQSKHLKYV